jgi:hypothetical protein
MEETLIIPDELVIRKIYLIRNQKVMLDSDLADLYGEETKRINEQVKRNLERFPEDFMFQLTDNEFINLKSHFATSSWGGRRKLPYVFTEHGVLMLSSVLNSKKSIAVNIQIVRIFTAMRELILTNNQVLLELNKMKSMVEGQDDRIDMIYNYLQEFIKQKNTPSKTIGYKPQ